MIFSHEHLSAFDDTQRLEKLRRLQLLDSPTDAAFDRLTRLASDILKMPVSLVSLIDVDRQFFKSQIGLPEPWATTRQTPLSHSFCQHVVSSNDVLIVRDARDDALLKDNLAVRDLNVIAYAGIPLTTSDNVTLGSFCVIDSQPHDWTEHEIRILRDLAAAVITEIELRSELLERQEAEQALQQQQVFLHNLINNIPNLIALKDDAGRFVLANQALAALYDTTPEALTGKTDAEIAGVREVNAFLEGDREVIATGEDLFIPEEKVTDAGGDERWFQLVKTPLRNQEDTQTLVLMTATDITRRKTVEERFRQAQQETRRVLDISLDLIGTANFEGYFTRVNPAFERILGYSSEELLSRPFIDFVHPEDVEMTVAESSRILAEGSTDAFENRYRTRSGEYRWLSWKAVPDVEQEVTHFVARDITNEKSIRDAVRESEQEYRQILDTIHDFVLLKGAQSRILWANKAFRDYYGMSNEELQGLVDAPFVEPDYTQQYVRDDEHVFTTGEVLHIPEEPVMLHDGVVRHFYTIKSPVFNDNNEVIMTVGTSRDITELKLAAEKLEAALMQEKKLNELKSRFISLVSHQFKNPLAVIQSSATLLKKHQDRLNEEQKTGKLESIISQVQRMTDLLNNTLILTRTDMMGLNFNPVDLNLHSFCASIVEDVRLTCEETHSIDFSADGDCDGVSVDKDLLHHVLTNILSNAVKYSPEGGTVYFDLLCEQQHVTMCIQDEGIGIPQADQADLFGSFRRATNVGMISGTGLGLVIAKQAIEAHGGAIDFESEEGIGTTFIISIPRQHLSPIQEDVRQDSETGGPA